MANICEQTVTLYGPTEKIVEVINYIKSLKERDIENGYFGTNAFQLSCCAIMKENEFILVTKYTSPMGDLRELSKLFPDVGFHSESFTDGQGEREYYYLIGGDTLYGIYFDVQSPEYWEKKTGIKMKNFEMPELVIEH
jgi:hypothetical protein